MDCLQAQEIISAALDGAAPSGALLDEAKEHCRWCPECSSFVKTLVALRRTAPPEPPDDLTSRIMAAIASQPSRAAEEHPEALSPGLAEQLANVETSTVAALLAGDSSIPRVSALPNSAPLRDATAGRTLLERASSPANRRAVATWVAAAAVVLVMTGIGSMIGIKAMFRGGGTNDLTVLESTAVDEGEVMSSAPSESVGGEQPQASAKQYSDTANGTLIALNGMAYRAAGPDPTVSKESLSEVGTTRTSLVSGSLPRQEPVLGTSDPARVFIASATGEMLAFDRVTTSFEGRTYVLRSGEIDQYGGLATLPADIAEPTSTDGYPTFEALGDAAPGVFVRKGQDAKSGIAYPPGTKADVSAGWTWWTPAP